MKMRIINVYGCYIHVTEGISLLDYNTNDHLAAEVLLRFDKTEKKGYW